MKRGKEDEKVMGPLFPRLHVNEREKGGPRAPPRNKMALYEQLSIPSQRFNPGLNPNHNTSSAASLTQGSGNKRPMFSPLHLPRSTPLTDNSYATSSECNTSSVAPQKRLDEEDFAVPVFVQPENDQNNINSDIVDQANVSLSRPAQINRSSRNQSSNKKRKLSSTRISNVRQKDKCQIQELQCPPEDQEDREHLTNDMDGSQSSNDALHHEVIDVSQMQSVHNVTSNGEYHQDKTGYSLGIRNRDECDDDSDTSMVDSVSGVYITPDEVVGVIGQKHFWKARRAIVNQQRVFAVQVFELHRLIKVQKLFAGSPDLIHEGTSFVGKTSKASIPKQISLEFIVKPSANLENCKENHLNHPSQKTEGSAETAVGKSSLSSSQNVSHHHPSNGIPFSPNPQLTPVTTDPSSSPWYFNQPTGHHWLVPVMSPTEGLVYKPYAGPGHTGSNPTMSNFANHPYGIPNSHPFEMLNYHPFFQGMGIPPSFPSMTHQGYFPPYCMPPMGSAILGSVVNQVVNQGNHFMGTSFTEQRQNSYSGSTQKNDSKPNTPNFVETENDRESKLQVSTASSPGEGRNGLNLFPTSPADDVVTENLTRAIKVVPHNAVSANESAFRIFQSIQKERETVRAGVRSDICEKNA